MSDIREEVRTYLLGISAITAITSVISPHKITNLSEAPYIAFEVTSQPSIHHLVAAAALVKTSFQFDCYGTLYKQSSDLADAVRSGLDGFRGVMGAIDITSSMITGAREEDDLLQDASDRTLYDIVVDVDIMHFRSVPTFS